ncbi:MAG: hypothetical protein H0T76_22315 [Nannocystis sp.]|nr:hypothetical protein [Nannocystis sp.]MBA3549217.1 hypothetical protein [Nannocystis sp.]
MKRLSMFTGMMSATLLLGACEGGAADEGGSEESGDTAAGEEVCDSEISGNIESDTVWACDHTLTSIVTVKNGAKLTVAPGVTIKAGNGTALVIGKGSQLLAEGTADQPIVFTSALPEGSRARGDWGGLVLLGEAPNNLQTGTGAAEGLDANDPTYQYGGSDATSSCGSLKYVRVEFAGFELTKDNELNGITFYSCGSGTRVDYVQSHMGADDGIEAFGGNWSGKHIVITGALDDSFDADQGYTGSLQYVFIHQDPATGNYGFEWSNQKDNLDASPRTRPVVSNLTFIGTATNPGSLVMTKSSAIKLKEGTGAEIHNAIFAYSYNAAIELTEEATEIVADAGDISLTDTILFKNSLADAGASPYKISDGSTWDLKAFFEDAGNRNHIDVDPKLGSITWGAADIVPAADSPALGNGRAVAGAEPTDFIGAVKDASSDWTKGWTNYAPN